MARDKEAAPVWSGGVIIPSYNSGHLLRQTVGRVLSVWGPVIVVLDGSSDGSRRDLVELEEEWPLLHVVELPVNRGKGAAVLAGLEAAGALGVTHAAVFDADGQHEAADLPLFMEASARHPDAMILGDPIFGPDAPTERVIGRKLGNWFANLETLWGGIGDSLFGFRVYPVGTSLRILRATGQGRRFDFDTQLVVRLYWEGVVPLNIPTRVYYPAKCEGGVSHFRYARDNLLLAAVHAWLCLRALFLMPRLFRFRRRPGPRFL
jgi:glycosyltransferase involved in cell wall biosynthesis